MIWHNKETYTSLDRNPVSGLFFLDGDVISRASGSGWTRGMKSSVIVFPSSLMCEIEDSPTLIIHLCGGLCIPYFSTRENAFNAVLTENEIGFCSLFYVGETGLELWHHETETVWFITYDSHTSHIDDVFVIQPY